MEKRVGFGHQNAPVPPPVTSGDFGSFQPPPATTAGTLPQMPNSTQMPPVIPPQVAPGTEMPPVPDMGMVAGLPSASMAQNPGLLSALAKLLQGSPGVDDWRRKMDMAQFARQGE